MCKKVQAKNSLCLIKCLEQIVKYMCNLKLLSVLASMVGIFTRYVFMHFLFQQYKIIYH